MSRHLILFRPENTLKYLVRQRNLRNIPHKIRTIQDPVMTMSNVTINKKKKNDKFDLLKQFSLLLSECMHILFLKFKFLS